MAWLAGFAKRTPFTLNKDEIDENLTHFAVRVHLSSACGRGAAYDMTRVFDELENNANRKKIALTKADGVTQIYCEIEKWDHASEQAELWVSKSDWIVLTAENTPAYIYYDKTHADNDAFVGDVGLAGRDGPRENVWDIHSKMVHHMKDETTSAIIDSTSNDNDGTKRSANNPVKAAGKISEAQDFSTDYINYGTGASLDITDKLTLECVFKQDAPGYGTFRTFIGKWNHPAGDIMCYLLRIGNTDKVGFAISVDGTNPGVVFIEGAVHQDTDYHYAAGVSSGNGNPMDVFVDGVSENTDTAVAIHSEASEPLYGGALQATPTEHMDGIIDEIRVSNTNRSDAWIKATKHSLWDNLLSFGSEETSGWLGKVAGVTNPAKVMGVDVANIAKVKGVSTA